MIQDSDSSLWCRLGRWPLVPDSAICSIFADVRRTLVFAPVLALCSIASAASILEQQIGGVRAVNPALSQPELGAFFVVMGNDDPNEEPGISRSIRRMQLDPRARRSPPIVQCSSGKSTTVCRSRGIVPRRRQIVSSTDGMC